MVHYVGDNGPDGMCVGKTSTDKVGFFGTTPIVQRSGSTQSALTLVTATTSGFGFSTSAAFTAFTDQLEELRAALVAHGLIAGS